VRAKLDERGPFDMVWLTVNTPAAPASYRLSAELSRAGVLTVIGGIHASVRADEAARYARCVVTGEAEGVIDLLLADYDARGTIAPSYKGGNRSDLAHLPYARWDKLGYRPAVLPVQTSRGCRNACAFCSTTRFQGTRRRHRPPQEIVAEIQHYRESGFLGGTTIFFTDNNIVSDSDHRRNKTDTSYARELFEALIPLQIKWAGQGEIGLADDRELVELAALSGCQTLLVGFETLDQNNLGDVHKPSNTVDRYVEQIRVLHEWGISLIGCFIFGLDQDTPDVFDKTLAFIQKHIDTPQLSIMTAYPGTALHRRLTRESRILHEDWSRFDILNVTHRPARMTPQELCDGFADLSRRTYALPRIVARAARFACGVRFGPAVHESWIERFARVVGPNVYYRALAHYIRPSIEPTAEYFSASELAAHRGKAA
jgi:radical SAM superfamily enzyme YgiQ (UPF0313 family)